MINFHFKKIKAKDIEKYNKLTNQGFCERCGGKEKLIVHHIKPLSVGGKRDYDNLAVLCVKCHRVVKKQTNKIFDILRDWDSVSFLVKSSLKLRRLREWKLQKRKLQN